MLLQRLLRRRRAGSDPEFKLQLRDKGPSGLDYGIIYKERNGWTWERVDPSKSSGGLLGHARRYQMPSEILQQINDYTTMDKDAQEAAAFFEELAKTESSEMPAVASLLSIAARVASVRYRGRP
jgi:hypothetical protein